MPNWCAGNIRFRGTKKNIKRFLMDEIVSCRMVDHETAEEKPNIEDEGYRLVITKPHDHSWFYIKGTRRNFFETDVIEVWFDEDDEDKEIIVCIDNYKVAWSFEYVDAWKDFVRRYGFDVKMVGFERGCMFVQIKTIWRNGTVTDDVTEYKSGEDWDWNCLMPNYGG